VRALVVAEFYPRAEDPVLGVWAHRQALATRDAGADVHVVVLHRLVPAKRDVAGGPRQAARSLARKLGQPRRTELDGLPVTYAPFVSPPRGMAYGSWGAWATRALGRAVRHAGPFDVVHAHNAVPAGDAVRRLGLPAPLVVSVHGGDVYHTAERSLNVARTFTAARLVLANSTGIAERARRLGAADVRVVRLGTDVPGPPGGRRDGPPTLVTVAHLIGRKRHADVLRALTELPGVRYEIVGDGPERGRLEALARELGVAGRVVFHGQLPHEDALRTARAADVFVLPSTDEAFGVAYVEAMAAGMPAIGRTGEPGPEEIAALGGGMLRTTGDDLPAVIRRALDEREALGRAARETVLAHFTWERCGRATVAAYESVLAAR
jgi:glycosyltransferase involved in cell wall biosynthesis